MAFGDILQQTHYYRGATRGTLTAGSTLSLQFANPTQQDSIIVIMMTAGLFGITTSALLNTNFTLEHPNWTFTERQQNVSGTQWSAGGRIFDCLNAPVGFGAVTMRAITDVLPYFHLSMFEVAAPTGAVVGDEFSEGYGEGYCQAMCSKPRELSYNRTAFYLFKFAFATNSTSIAAGAPHNPTDYSMHMGLPYIYRSTPIIDEVTPDETIGMCDLQVFAGTMDRQVPSPTEIHAWFGAAGASINGTGHGISYLEGSNDPPAVVDDTMTAADKYGGGGSYSWRASIRKSTSEWTVGATTVSLQTPTSTTTGDAVFLFAAWRGYETNATTSVPVPNPVLPTGFVELDSGYLQPNAHFSAQDNGWPPLKFAYPKQRPRFESWQAAEWTPAIYYVVAVKPITSTPVALGQLAFDAGWPGFYYTASVINMPTEAQVIAAKTGGYMRRFEGHPDGTGDDGNVAIGGSFSAGGKEVNGEMRLFGGQKAKSTDYVVAQLFWSAAFNDVGSAGLPVVPKPSASSSGQSLSRSGIGNDWNLILWSAGSDPNARLNTQYYLNNLDRNRFFMDEAGSKMWAFGVPYVPPEDNVVWKPPSLEVHELPYDLRNIQLGGQVNG